MDILPVIIFVLIGVGGSMLSAKQKRERQAEQKELEDESEPESESTEPPFIPAGSQTSEESYIPMRESVRKPQPQPRNRQRNSAIQSPEFEGASAIERSEDNANADDPYALHPDLPAAGSDWRKAILAHEILKTKF